MLASGITVKRLGPDYYAVTGVINGVSKSIPMDGNMLRSLIIRATESQDAPYPNQNGLRIPKKRHDG